MDDLQDGKDIETYSARPTQGHAVLHLVIGFAFFVGFLLLLSGVAFMVFGSYIYGGIPSEAELNGLVNTLMGHPLLLKLFNFMGSSIPFVAAAFMTCVVIQATPKHYLSLDKPMSTKWFALSILFVFICVPLLGLMLEINQLLDLSQWPELVKMLESQELVSTQMYEAMIGDGGTISFLASIIFMALVPALAEEIFFRGFLTNVFNGIFRNMHVSIFITSILFSAIHMQFMKALPMFFLAMSFGYAAYWSGTIWTSIAAHFVNNSFAVYQLYYLTDGDYTKAIEEGPSVPMYGNVLLIVMVVSMLVYIQKNSNVKTQNFYV